MKTFLPILLLLLSSAIYGQVPNYEKWKEEANTNTRLLPKYGNAPKSEELKEVDQKLIDGFTAQNINLQDAAKQMVSRGFEYLYKGDFQTAMYRFNQAWLLDPKNENVFWGFAGIYFNFNDYDQSLVQIEEGLSINPKSSNLLTEKGNILMSRYSITQNQTDITLAGKIFQESYQLNPKNQNTLLKLSMYYLFNGDCKDAKRYYEECKALGGKNLTKEYAEALAQQCN